jgi:uracil-DNA glycosylase family 4
MSLDQQQRIAYLQAMGIPVWLSRQNTSTPTTSEAKIAETSQSTVAEPTPHFNVASKIVDSEQKSAKSVTAKSSTKTHSDAVDNTDVSNATWESLENCVTNCQRCEIHRYRTQTVFGVGHHQADWMIIGEAPGADEDRQGEPFVGRAGQLLTNILAAINLPREQVYIANVLKCRPPNNRDPHKKEIQHCQGYLKRQIELVQPKVILVVGRIAAHTLLQTQLPVGRMRGKIHHLPELQIPLVVTYHPAYLLRQPVEKRKVWEDLKRAREVYDPLTQTQPVADEDV